MIQKRTRKICFFIYRVANWYYLILIQVKILLPLHIGRIITVIKTCKIRRL